MTAEPSKYYSGNPCQLGHTLRYVKNKMCVECHKLDAKERREEGKQKPTDFQHRVTVLGNPDRTL
ncbi:hypothetical protein [Xenorhabdus sp. BG5]|uniref:hypothetical protein n=1 Tax=Xenorhabdus sp. BG5 TaxID=2782014 RepID=UPI00187DE715|nr:hypothetical protein [Xenorhabdus sp. BG5]MBE8596811.1 hypothetical protein [Xenorhabdus sp. BG5]MBE8598083.1 hypothetical protein [Xenorhabdus sp. BG5]MBE8598231.1 hypothetical protein [Xenorhabdus sp. BG5]